MRKAFDLKHIRERSFMINGLTAKWGIGDARKPPFWDTALIARYDVREVFKENFASSDWTVDTAQSDVTVSRSGMLITNTKTQEPFLTSVAGKNIPELRVTVTGIDLAKGDIIKYSYGSGQVLISTNGTVNLPANTSGTPSTFSAQKVTGESNIRIEQFIPNIPNTAKPAVKPGTLAGLNNTYTENGALVFNGVDGRGTVGGFLMPTQFTILFDVDWLGDVDTRGGIGMYNTFSIFNRKTTNQLYISLGDSPTAKLMPNTIVGVSTDDFVYNKDGSRAALNTTVNIDRTPQKMFIGHMSGSNYTKLAFRSLYIFNRELTPAEMQEALAAMFS